TLLPIRYPRLSPVHAPIQAARPRRTSEGCPELDHREERVTIVDSLGTDGKKPSKAANTYTTRWTHQASATPRIQSSSCPVRDSSQLMVSPMRPLRRRPRRIALDPPGWSKRVSGAGRLRAGGARGPAGAPGRAVTPALPESRAGAGDQEVLASALSVSEESTPSTPRVSSSARAWV